MLNLIKKKRNTFEKPHSSEIENNLLRVIRCLSTLIL